MYKILFLSSNPSNRGHLKVDSEFKKIRAKLRAAENRDMFEISNESSILVEDFSATVRDNNPQIIHFSGHGNVRTLSFSNNQEESEEVRAEDLGRILETLNKRAQLKDEQKIQLVVLNACYSESLIRAISPHVKYVVGMIKEITDDAAVTFSETFYDNLCNGQSLETSFELGCRQIGLDPKLDGEEIPKLYVPGGVDASKVFFTETDILLPPQPTKRGQATQQVKRTRSGQVSDTFTTTSNESKVVSSILGLFRISDSFATLEAAKKDFANQISEDEIVAANRCAQIMNMICTPLSRDMSDSFEDVLKLIPRESRETSWKDVENLNRQISNQFRTIISTLENDPINQRELLESQIKSLKNDFETIRKMIIEETVFLR